MNRIGVKLVCATCGAQAIVIKSGTGTLSCHGAPMTAPAAAPPRP